MKNMIAILFVFAASGIMAPAALADFTQAQKITSTPRGVGAQHGNSIGISGNTMVVGAQFDGTTASQAGAAYVYVFDGTAWTQQAVLLAGDGAVADKFGTSVAINENTIVVGAFNDDSPLSNAGSAYVFVRSGTVWSFQQKLTAADQTADDQFGFSVAILGDSIAVGANHADQPGNSEAGAVYTYFRGGTVWTPGPKLLPVAPVILGDHFGDSLAFNGTRLVVGASGDDTPQTAAGAVYVYVAGNLQFIFEQKLTIADGTNGDQFGFSVAIDGTTIVGGAKEDSTVVGQVGIGAAYVFTSNGSTWSQQQKLLASDGAAFDRFGYSVAVHGDTVAVGAREDDTAVGPDAGSDYVFTRTGTVWTERQRLTPSDPLNGDRFGISTAFNSAGNLMVGAAEKQLTNPNGQGAVYYFKLPPVRTRFDFDGDGKADIGIYRPSNGQWWYQRSIDYMIRATTFGVSTDKPVPADFDGDGKTDIAIYRPSTGEWFVLRSSNGTFYGVPFGISTDKPVPADYDGDGLADVAVFRPSEGVWYILRSMGGVQFTQWGAAADVPVPSDYDGDGRSDTAIFRPADGSWWINRTTGPYFVTTFGVSTDKPVPADFTGDGKTDVVVWRPSSGNWYILRSEDLSFYGFPFGSSGDIPVAGDYDGDGRADAGVFRPVGANWFVQRSTQGILIQQFGISSDIPLPSVFIQ
jgi:hypothetical protein